MRVKAKLSAHTSIYYDDQDQNTSTGQRSRDRLRESSNSAENTGHANLSDEVEEVEDEKLGRLTAKASEEVQDDVKARCCENLDRYY
jgi:hypothetical protein